MKIGCIICGMMMGIVLGVCGMYQFQKKEKTIYYKKVSNDQQYLMLMNQWFILKQKRLQIADLFKKRNIKHIAVYGMGIYGRHLIRELELTEIIIDYGIDKKVTIPYRNIDVRKLNKHMEEVDAVVNTVVWARDEVEEQLALRYSCPILHLEDLVFERYRMDGNKKDEELL